MCKRESPQRTKQPTDRCTITKPPMSRRSRCTELFINNANGAQNKKKRGKASHLFTGAASECNRFRVFAKISFRFESDADLRHTFRSPGGPGKDGVVTYKYQAPLFLHLSLSVSASGLAGWLTGRFPFYFSLSPRFTFIALLHSLAMSMPATRHYGHIIEPAGRISDAEEKGKVVIFSFDFHTTNPIPPLLSARKRRKMKRTQSEQKMPKYVAKRAPKTLHNGAAL